MHGQKNIKLQCLVITPPIKGSTTTSRTMCPQNLQSEQLRNLYLSTDGNATTNETGPLLSVPCRAEKTHTIFLLEIRGK